MKGRISKGRRINSLEPNKIVRATFATKYVNHFMPALLKIVNHEKRIPDENGDCICELYKKVKYEVDMALVMSTQGLFAWSHALKRNLQTNLNVGRLQSSSLHNSTPLKCGDNSLCSTCVHNANLSTEIPPNPNQNPKILTKKLRSLRPQKVRMPPRMKREAKRETKEEELISSRSVKLRSLLPGGDEMGDDKLLSEIESYIVCLELQVNVLKCLTDFNSFDF